MQDAGFANHPGQFDEMYVNELDINSVNFPTAFLRAYKAIRDGDKIQDGLFRAQKLVEQFMVNPTVRGLLIYHELGSGKTTTGLASAILLGRPTIIWCAKSIRQIFVREYGFITGMISRDSDSVSESDTRKIRAAMRVRKIEFATSNAANKVDQLYQAAFRLTGMLRKSGHFEGMTIISDECHRIFSLIANGTDDGIALYTLLRETEDLKMVFMSGTPIVNDPYELVVMANLMSSLDYAFMEDYEDFYQSFIESDPDKGMIGLKNTAIMRERLVGLISHFPGHKFSGDAALFPKNDGLEIIKAPMSTQQWLLYKQYRAEEKLETMNQMADSSRTAVGSKSGESFSTFRIKSRMASNFVLPGDVLKRHRTKGAIPQALYDDVKPKELKGASAKILSPKYTMVRDRLDKYKTDKHMVYSSFLNKSGLNMLGRFLEAGGWTRFDPNAPKTGTDGRRFVIWSGDLGELDRHSIQNTFNSADNKTGKAIRVVMISPAGTEGLSLMAVKYVHIIEPHWNITRLRQVVGRALRYKSHVDLPPKGRFVKSFMYIATPPADITKNFTTELKKVKGAERAKRVAEFRSTDEHILLSAQRKQRVIDEMLTIMKSVSIDCSYYWRPESNYTCFVCTPRDTNIPLNYETVGEQMAHAGERCIPPIALPIKSMTKVKTKEKLGLYKYKGKTYLLIPDVQPPQFVEVAKTPP